MIMWYSAPKDGACKLFGSEKQADEHSAKHAPAVRGEFTKGDSLFAVYLGAMSVTPRRFRDKLANMLRGGLAKLQGAE